jgi:hypothetical protein
MSVGVGLAVAFGGRVGVATSVLVGFVVVGVCVGVDVPRITVVGVAVLRKVAVGFAVGAVGTVEIKVAVPLAGSTATLFCPVNCSIACGFWLRA